MWKEKPEADIDSDRVDSCSNSSRTYSEAPASGGYIMIDGVCCQGGLQYV